MKFFLTVIPVAIWSQLFGIGLDTRIELRFRKVNGGNIAIICPVNQLYYPGADTSYSIDKNGISQIHLKENQTGFVTIRFFNLNSYIKIFIQKGDRLTIEIDTSDHQDMFNFKGSNEEGQLLLTRQDLPYAAQVVSKYKQDTTAFLLENHILLDKANFLGPFKILFAAGKIDKTFYTFIVTNLNYYFSSVATQIIANKYYWSTLAISSLPKRNDFPIEYSTLWKKLYKAYPPNEKKALETPAYSDGFFTYAGNYIEWYLSYEQEKSGRGVAMPDSAPAYFRTIFRRMRDYLNPEVSEFVEANRLEFELFQHKYQGYLIDLVTEFQSIYPQSPYAVYLQAGANRIIEFQTQSKKSFTKEQLVMDDYLHINSFDQLIARFKGKLIFIQIWATWCIPCKAQFAYEDSLNKVLKENGIESIFISMDNSPRDSLWRSMVKYYNLRGNHIRANNSLIADLEKIFWNGSGYTIPRYVIVDKNGKIAEANASRPSDGRLLFEQIKKKLPL